MGNSRRNYQLLEKECLNFYTLDIIYSMHRECLLLGKKLICFFGARLELERKVFGHPASGENKINSIIKMAYCTPSAENSTLGVISLPSSPIAFVISNVARIEAAKIQILFWAR